MKVADIMTKHVLTVTPKTPISKAIQLMPHYHWNDLIVMEEENNLLGIVTHSDLCRKVLPSYDEIMRDETYWLNPENMESRFFDILDLPVKEAMAKKLNTITPDTNVIKAGAIMSAHRIKQLPVVENDCLIGIVSYSDISWGLILKNCLIK